MLKQIIFLIILVFVISLNSIGQSSYFTVKTAYSLPLGEYASYELDGGAFAYTGLSLGVDGAWYFHKNIGIGADLSYSLHSVDAVALATETLYASEDPFLNDLYVRSDPYKVLSMNLGLVYNFHITDKLSLEPRFLVGLMMAWTPFQLYEAEYYLLPDDYFKKTTSRDENFSIKTGLAVKYDLSPCLMIKVAGEYSYGKMNFGFTNSSGPYIQELKISYLDMGMGIVYKLN